MIEFKHSNKKVRPGIYRATARGADTEYLVMIPQTYDRAWALSFVVVWCNGMVRTFHWSYLNDYRLLEKVNKLTADVS